MTSMPGLACWAIFSATLTLAGCAPGPEPEIEAHAAPAPSETPVPAVLPAPRPASHALHQRIDAALHSVEQREVLTTHGFWTVFHGILGVGTSLNLWDPDGQQAVRAVDWISQGKPLRGMQFLPTPYGLDVQLGPTFVGQGHADQFIAEMLQAGWPVDLPLSVQGRSYTLHDFCRQTESRVRITADQELSWSLVVIGQLRGTAHTWTNAWGESLCYPDLVRYELRQPIESAACGGTHRLFGLAWAAQMHARGGDPDPQIWAAVDDLQSQFQTRAREWQNPDGSFSTGFFREPGADSDLSLRINTTGHVLEWLALSLSDRQLQAPWVAHAANALAVMLLESQNQLIESGALYHAAHALRMYSARHRGFDLDEN